MKRGALRQERGFALLSVLWGVALLSLIATVLLSTAFSMRRTASAALDQTRFESMAEAGRALAILGLMEPDPAKRWRVNGTPREVVFDGARLRIAVRDEYGRVDLNAADVTALRQLLRYTSGTFANADALADRIVDWRDMDSLRQLNGAEADDYRTAGKNYAPRNDAFQTVDELRLILGMDEAVFAKLAPLVTVYSHRPGVNLYTASAEMVAALGAQAAASNATGGGPLIDGVINIGIPLANWPFRIQIDVLDGEKIAYSTETVLRITDDPERPALIHWQQALAIAPSQSGQ